LFRQDYPHYEVVVINDRSTDGTAEVLEEFERKYPLKLKTVKVEFQEWKSFIGNKKFALTMGIKAASNNYLLFTDADCRPASDQWIRKMLSPFANDEIELVLGYGKYARRKGLLNILIRFETLLAGMQYTGFALRKIPYMGVGRNLAYTKNLFFRNDGFKNHFEIPSGDDDLFVNENATDRNTAVCLSPESQTVSEPEKRWKDYFRQKRRHYSTARYYKLHHRLLLGAFAFFKAAFWITAFYLCAKGLFCSYIAAGTGLYVGWVAYAIWRTGRKWNDSVSFWSAAFAEFLLIWVQILIFVSGIFVKKNSWR
jgi:glycosyltransferase involved in cell wall biosynthesis